MASEPSSTRTSPSAPEQTSNLFPADHTVYTTLDASGAPDGTVSLGSPTAASMFTGYSPQATEYPMAQGYDGSSVFYPMLSGCPVNHHSSTPTAPASVPWPAAQPEIEGLCMTGTAALTDLDIAQWDPEAIFVLHQLMANTNAGFSGSSVPSGTSLSPYANQPGQAFTPSTNETSAQWPTPALTDRDADGDLDEDIIMDGGETSTSVNRSVDPAAVYSHIDSVASPLPLSDHSSTVSSGSTCLGTHSSQPASSLGKRKSRSEKQASTKPRLTKEERGPSKQELTYRRRLAALKYKSDPDECSREFSTRVENVIYYINALIKTTNASVFFYASRPESITALNGKSENVTSPAADAALKASGLDDLHLTLHDIMLEAFRKTHVRAPEDVLKKNTHMAELKRQRDEAEAGRNAAEAKLAELLAQEAAVTKQSTVEI